MLDACRTLEAVEPLTEAVNEPDERALLRSLLNGDREAAEAMVDRTFRGVYACLFQFCGDADLAADLAQEAYRKAWEALPGFDGRARLSTWLHRIAYTTFLNHRRAAGRWRPLEEAGDLPDPASAPGEALDRNDRAERLRAAVGRLPEPLRATLAARYWAGLSAGEIARAEGVTAVAVRKRLKRAFGMLSRALEEA
jgi:RNA polymerase sigma-70 factor (ECF subfamily)